MSKRTRASDASRSTSLPVFSLQMGVGSPGGEESRAAESETSALSAASSDMSSITQTQSAALEHSIQNLGESLRRQDITNETINNFNVFINNLGETDGSEDVDISVIDGNLLDLFSEYIQSNENDSIDPTLTQNTVPANISDFIGKLSDNFMTYTSSISEGQVYATVDDFTEEDVQPERSNSINDLEKNLRNDEDNVGGVEGEEESREFYIGGSGSGSDSDSGSGVSDLLSSPGHPNSPSSSSKKRKPSVHDMKPNMHSIGPLKSSAATSIRQCQSVVQKFQQAYTYQIRRTHKVRWLFLHLPQTVNTVNNG